MEGVSETIFDKVKEGISRRTVLTAATLAAAGCCCVSLAGCQTQKDKPALITSGTVSLGPAADYPAGSASTHYVETYGIVVVNDSGTPIAIRPKCTHMGCTAVWKNETHQFECPCHGSRFNLLGQPTHGPAQRPLPAVVCIKQADGNISVDLTKLYSM